MARAVAVGERGRRTSPPNPWVGCVIVHGDEVVGEGFHRAAGEPHAEVRALSTAAERAHGATAYVTLEPCAHVGRTGPCYRALIRAGVKRVVVGVVDPDPRVAGRGIRGLKDAGVDVQVGVGEAEAGKSLAPYLHQRRTGRAFALLKAAVSVDGRTAAADGTARWISGPTARADAHALRAESQAILVGSGTALADRPALTVREVEPPAERQPLRVLLDASGRVPPEGPLFDQTLAPTLVLTTSLAPEKAVRAWQQAGALVDVLGKGADGGVDLEQVLRVLAERGVVQVLVEGGGRVHGAFLRAGLMDRLILYVAGCTLGEEGRPLFAGSLPRSIHEAPRLKLLGAQVLGDDVRLDYAPCA